MPTNIATNCAFRSHFPTFMNSCSKTAVKRVLHRHMDISHGMTVANRANLEGLIGLLSTRLNCIADFLQRADAHKNRRCK